jgi:hypothetical protein
MQKMGERYSTPCVRQDQAPSKSEPAGEAHEATGAQQDY